MKSLGIVPFVWLLLLAACADGVVVTTTEAIPPGTTIVPTAPTTGATPGPPASTEAPAPGEEFSDLIVTGDPILLTSTHRVANVPSDDVLNARRVPGAGGPLVAELDPAYSTFRFTGESLVAADGGTWMKIVLSDPAVQLVSGPEPYELPWGWVNSFYTEPLTEFAPIGGACTPDGQPQPHVGDPNSTYDQLIDVLLLDFDGCSQLIVTLAEAGGPDHLGTTLPNVGVEAIPDGLRLTIPPPGSGWLHVLWPATELITADLEVYVVRGVDGEVWIDIHGAGAAEVSYLETKGQVVVNLANLGGPLPDRNGSIVAHPAEETSANSWTISGQARPFEANLSVSVRDNDDAVVAVPVSGPTVNVFGPGAFSVMTYDWSETWGSFEFTVDMSGLPTGDYVVRLADTGATEDGPVVDVPIVIP